MKAKKLCIIAVTIAFLITPITLQAYEMQKNQTSQINSRSFPIRVACVGDSITQDSGYPSDLQTMLGSNYTVGNFGSRESTVLRISWKPYMNQPEFQDAKDFSPDIVVIMLGTNDGLKMLHSFNETFDDDYIALVNSFQELESKPQIWVAKPPPIFSNSPDLSSEYYSETIIPMTENIATELNLPVIDVYNAFGDNASYLSADGVHPNNDGAALIASEVYKALLG
ncbi:MAG: GDSL-type esterase/lipase family protein [Candidatus Bathyarchaeota archaeon]|nr:GDSL-type esterase/lipase family protein [Candidatus Bathyarchaeota archaeon]